MISNLFRRWGKRWGKRRGVFSEDVLIAAFLACLTVTVGVYAITASAARFSGEYEDSVRQETALALSERLLKKCFSDGGLARCGNGAVFSHEIDERFAVFRAENVSVTFWNEFGERIRGTKKVGYSTCVTRIALLEGSEMVVRACVGGGD